jgi:hypothetical protein
MRTCAWISAAVVYVIAARRHIEQLLLCANVYSPQKGFWGVDLSLLNRHCNGRKHMPKVYDGIVRTSLGGELANIGKLGLMATNAENISKRY